MCVCVCVKNRSPYEKSLHSEFYGWNFPICPQYSLKNQPRIGQPTGWGPVGCGAGDTIPVPEVGAAGVRDFYLHCQFVGSKRPGPRVRGMNLTAASLVFKMEMGVRDASAVPPATASCCSLR